MRAHLIAASAAATLVAVAPLASAQSEPVCDSYSSACPSASQTTIPPEVEPTRQNRPEPGGLVVTGGEIVTMLLIGTGAVAGGSGLVVAGRRRRGSHAA